MTAPARASRRAAIAAMSRYEPRRPPTRIDLSDNTSMWGPPPSVRMTLAGLTDAQLSRYPTPYADGLTSALAALHGVELPNVATGCGSDDLLDSAIRACCDAGSTIAVASPTFSVVPSFASLNEVAVAEVDVQPDGAIRAADLLATGADLYYLCSPNNPTGSMVSDDELAALCSSTEAVVLLDEAYVDFADTTALALIGELPNLVVVRTLSKAFGLAGLRVGYAVGRPGTISAISASRGPYKVSAVAEAVALGVLAEDRQWVADRVLEARELRDRFATRLSQAGFDVLGSSANFVAIRVADAAGAFERMLERGVLVRCYQSLRVFGDLLRITVAPQPLLDEAFEALVEATS